jgi:hypothetical protein
VEEDLLAGHEEDVGSYVVFVHLELLSITAQNGITDRTQRELARAVVLSARSINVIEITLLTR